MNERKTQEIMAAPATTSTMAEEVSAVSQMKRDRSTSPTVTVSPEREPQYENMFLLSVTAAVVNLSDA